MTTDGGQALGQLLKRSASNCELALDLRKV